MTHGTGNSSNVTALTLLSIAPAHKRHYCSAAWCMTYGTGNSSNVTTGLGGDEVC
jgi:hypothetical protein